MDVVGTVKATALVVARAASRRRIMVKNIGTVYAATHDLSSWSSEVDDG